MSKQETLSILRYELRKAQEKQADCVRDGCILTDRRYDYQEAQRRIDKIQDAIEILAELYIKERGDI